MADNETGKRLERPTKAKGRHSRESGNPSVLPDDEKNRDSRFRGNDGGGASEEKHVPERKCILSGEKAPREALIRLALSPDGVVAPDVRAKAAGRGAWIGVTKDVLEAAIAKGKLKGALSRAFKTAAILIPDDLPQQIEAALQRAALDRLGLEARAGTLLTGSEKIAEAARKGTVDLLLHARDAAMDGSRKLDQALRVGLDMEGSDTRGLVIPASRAILSMALGRENVVHIALIAPAAAARVSDTLGRWRGFIGRNDDAESCESSSQGPSAHRN
jgi:predicted RNA-binding protein YlxR (DUF448 family)